MTQDIGSISYHGVPWWKDDPIITLENLYKFLGCQSLRYYHLIHESVEEVEGLGVVTDGEK
jgi:hypothetical protein